MAVFKVGQRVRVIASDLPRWSYLIGREGVIEVANVIPWEWIVRIDAPHLEPDPTMRGCFGFHSHELAPLTDPGAESFIAKLKKLGSEPVNDAPKVRVTK